MTAALTAARDEPHLSATPDGSCLAAPDLFVFLVPHPGTWDSLKQPNGDASLSFCSVAQSNMAPWQITAHSHLPGGA